MGVNDAAEMLEAAKAECVRLERIIDEARKIGWEINLAPDERMYRMLDVLARAAGETGRGEGETTTDAPPAAAAAHTIHHRPGPSQTAVNAATPSIEAVNELFIQTAVRGTGLLAEMTMGLIAGESISITEADRRMQMRSRR